MMSIPVWSHVLSGGGGVLVPGGGGFGPGRYGNTLPLVNRLTGVKTLPSTTSFAGGKNITLKIYTLFVTKLHFLSRVKIQSNFITKLFVSQQNFLFPYTRVFMLPMTNNPDDPTVPPIGYSDPPR